MASILDHTPTTAVSPTGSILLVSGDAGQRRLAAPHPATGKSILVNDLADAGPWREIPAPVEVLNPNNDACRDLRPQPHP